MTRRLLALLVAGALFFVACGGGDGEQEDEAAARPECTGDLPEAGDVAGLPENFPAPDGAILTESDEAGPSTIVEGYFDADIEDAFVAYQDAFEEAGYDITKDEQETNDAEVFFAGENTTGQVNMFAECRGRTKLRITIRPG